MKTGFKNELDPKEIKNKKSPWDFTAPAYDQRSSRGVDAGCHYGQGHRQPVGHAGPAKSTAPCLPMGHVQTMNIYEES